MIINQHTLTEQQWAQLQAIAEETGQTADELIAAAVEHLIR